MAISYNTGTTGSASNASSVAITIPSGVLAGDVMVMSLAVFTEDSSAPTVSFSGGGGTWTQIGTTQVSQNGAVYSYGFAYYRVATSGDPGASLTISESGSSAGTTWLAVAVASYTGAGTSQPDVIGGTSKTGGSSTTIAFPSETTVTANDWALCISSGGNNGFGFSAPSGLTERQAEHSDAGIYAVIFDGNAAVGAGTNIGGQTFTAGATASNCFLTAFTIGLAPPSTGVTSYVTLAGTGLARPAGRPARADAASLRAPGIARPADSTGRADPVKAGAPGLVRAGDLSGRHPGTATGSAAVIRGTGSTRRSGTARMDAAGQVRPADATGRAAGTAAAASGRADPAAATGRTPVLAVAAAAVARAAAATGRAAAAAVSAPGTLAGELTAIGRQVYAWLAGAGAVSPAAVTGSTYRLMDGADGRPGVGSSVTTPPGVTSYSGPFQAGTVFSVTSGGMWLEGYWWWCPAGGDTGAQKFCLWQRTSTSTETLVPDSTVTSGTLTAAAMNYVPLPAPIQLAIGTLYVAATGWTVVNGFPDSNFQFGSGDPYVAGITNGPLVAWSDATAGGTNNWVGPTANWGLPQGVFGTGNAGGAADPTLNFPASGSNSANFWVDVQVTGTAPSGYDGSYRIWPNKFDAPGTGTDFAANYILGTEFALSEYCDLDNIWFYSPAGATQLPTQCCIWDVGTETMVPGTLMTSPSWSGAAGSGWVSASYSGVTLTAGDYKVSVWNGNASPTGFNEYTIDYFTTGYGQDGITSGPITVPDAADATSPGQSTYQTNSSSFVYPDQYVATEGQSYWVDVEVTPAGAAPVTSFAIVAGTAAAFPAASTARGSVSAVTAAPAVLPAAATSRAVAASLKAAALVSAEDATGRSPAATVTGTGVIAGRGATGRGSAVRVATAGVLRAAGATSRAAAAAVSSAGTLAAGVAGAARQIWAWLASTGILGPAGGTARADAAKIYAPGTVSAADSTRRAGAVKTGSPGTVTPADSTGRTGTVSVESAGTMSPAGATSRALSVPVAAAGAARASDSSRRVPPVTVAATEVTRAAATTRRLAAAAISAPGTLAGGLAGVARQVFAWLAGSSRAGPADSTGRADTVTVASAGQPQPGTSTTRVPAVTVAASGADRAAAATGRLPAIAVSAAGRLAAAVAGTVRHPFARIAGTGQLRGAPRTSRAAGTAMSGTGALDPQTGGAPVFRTFVLRASAPFTRWAAGQPFFRWRRSAPRTPESRKGPLT